MMKIIRLTLCVLVFAAGSVSWADEVQFYRFVQAFDCDGYNRWISFHPPGGDLFILSATGIVRPDGNGSQLLAEAFVGATALPSPAGNSTDGIGDNHTAPLVSLTGVLQRVSLVYGGSVKLQAYRNIHLYGWCLGGGQMIADIGIYYRTTP